MPCDTLIWCFDFKANRSNVTIMLIIMQNHKMCWYVLKRVPSAFDVPLYVKAFETKFNGYKRNKAVFWSAMQHTKIQINRNQIVQHFQVQIYILKLMEDDDESTVVVCDFIYNQFCIRDMQTNWLCKRPRAQTVLYIEQPVKNNWLTNSQFGNKFIQIDFFAVATR